MPYNTSCFALIATALIAKQMTMDTKEGPGEEKGQDRQKKVRQVGTC